MALALSTSWNAFRYDNSDELFFEIKGLGFKEIELSFNLTSTMVSAAGKLAAKHGLEIVSLHNYCPIPDGFSRQNALPDCYSLASFREEERRLAIKYTKRSIDTAASLAAKAVVLHCGKTEVSDRTRELINLFESGLQGSWEFLDLRQELIKERLRLCAPFFKNTLASLRELEHYARLKGVLLGIETRFYYQEIPSLEETGIILEEFQGSNIFYWHDTGHAYVLEKLGLASHKEYLDLYRDRMLGVHLHNVLGLKDHQAATTGEFDFSLLKPYLKKETIKVIEAHSQASAEEVRQGREFLEALFNEAA